MSETDLGERLDAVERAVTDDETDLTAVREAAALAAEFDELETRVAELEASVERLDASVQAVRGYAGNVRAVNREVERRASAALAKAETLESSVDGSSARVRHSGNGRRDAGGDGERSREDGKRRRGAEDLSRIESDDTDQYEGSRRAREGVSSSDRRSDGQSPGGAENQIDACSRTDAEGSSGDGSETERFIERVRDAL